MIFRSYVERPKTAVTTEDKIISKQNLNLYNETKIAYYIHKGFTTDFGNCKLLCFKKPENSYKQFFQSNIIEIIYRKSSFKMGFMNYAWSAVKFGFVVYLLKKVFNKVIEVVFNKVLYLPNSPSAEFKLPENNTEGSRSPEEYGYNYEDIEVITKDKVKLSGWFIYQDNPLEHPTMIIFHGNAGNIGTRLPNIQLFFEENNVNVVIVGYRGYGHSQGSPSERGLQLDSEAVFNWALNCSNIDNSKIYIFGRSMGGAVTINLASKYQKKIRGIIIENTFTSIRDMVSLFIPKPFRFLCSLFTPDFWPSINKMKDLTLPILFISGRKDSLIPYSQMDRLYSQTENSVYKKLYKVSEGEHNDTWMKDMDHYYTEINSFIETTTKIK